MRVSKLEQILEVQDGGPFLERVTAVLVGVLLFSMGPLLLTDNFENIPDRYRAKVQSTEEAPKAPPEHSAAIRLQQKVAGWTHNAGVDLRTFTPNISGLTHYQSRVLTIGSIIAALCLVARFFVRSQILAFLSLWCLIMLGLVIPVLLITSQDAPLDRWSDQAGKIQEKQQEHLRSAQ